MLVFFRVFMVVVVMLFFFTAAMRIVVVMMLRILLFRDAIGTELFLVCHRLASCRFIYE